MMVVASAVVYHCIQVLLFWNLVLEVGKDQRRMEICIAVCLQKINYLEKFIILTSKWRRLVSTVALISCFFPFIIIPALLFFYSCWSQCSLSSFFHLWQLLTSVIDIVFNYFFFVDIYRLCVKIYTPYLLIILKTCRKLQFIQ